MEYLKKNIENISYDISHYVCNVYDDKKNVRELRVFIEKKIEELIKKENKKLEESNCFKCLSCGAVYKKNSYALAQSAMGVKLKYACKCGNNISI